MPRANYGEARAALYEVLQVAREANRQYFGLGRALPETSVGEAVLLGLERRGIDQTAIRWVRDLPGQVQAWQQILNALEEEDRRTEQQLRARLRR